MGDRIEKGHWICANYPWCESSRGRDIRQANFGDLFKTMEIGLCKSCMSMTKKIDGKCGKCGARDE